jgi:hypothetical protein
MSDKLEKVRVALKSQLAGKRILFVGPVFHDYHVLIAEELRRTGATVEFFPERDYGFAFTFVNNFAPGTMKSFMERHYSDINNQTSSQKYDFLFVLRGYMLTDEFLNEFALRNPSAIRLMHQWDSRHNNSFTHLVPRFHRITSFDFQDCMNFPELRYLPNFYLEDVLQHASSLRPKFDLSFVGVYMKHRYDAVVRLKQWAKNHNYKFAAHIFIPFRTLVKEKIKGNSFDRSIITSSYLSRNQYLQLLHDSRVIVDVSHTEQTGLPYRVIDAIVAGKKVLTTNQLIKSNAHDFSDLIHVFNADRPDCPRQFIEEPGMQKEPPYPSLPEWIYTIFCSL